MARPCGRCAAGPVRGRTPSPRAPRAPDQPLHARRPAAEGAARRRRARQPRTTERTHACDLDGSA
ncbi:hypothetical protein ET495_12455 [Xylanimonas allomyrinae]|uniref:Uncharacterized protein n=1 Tax=Xylanimonas allomyrinae TaxID=2509459 RepID=A0A4P6ER18_9MICO|nr:hypothetical protein ET495_12455 [Xylanimonas allomyrinae]